MEKGSHCLYLMWETDFVNLVLGLFWLPRNLSVMHGVCNWSCLRDGQDCSDSYPWSLGHVSEVLCHCGSRSQELQDIIAKMCHIFHVGLKKPSQYYVHLLFWNLFIEDNFLVILFWFFFPEDHPPFLTKPVQSKAWKKRNYFTPDF